MKTWMTGIVALAAVATLAMWTLGSRTVQTVEAAAELNQPAPAFTLTDIAGNEHSLADFEGKIVVLHWQSMQCPWDVAYQPILNGVAEDYADQDVVFLAINSNKTETDTAALTTYAEGAGMPYPILKEDGHDVADLYGAEVTPHIFIINAEGALVYEGGIESRPRNPGSVGESDDQYLVPVLDALVAGEDLPYTDTQATGCGVKR